MSSNSAWKRFLRQIEIVSIVLFTVGVVGVIILFVYVMITG